MPIKAKLGILLSGRGSNFIAIADAIARNEINCEIATVISNIPEAPGLLEARKRNIPTESVPSKGTPREQHDEKVIAALKAANIDYVILAGYMRVLTPGFIQAFPDRILNIHPSLLPAFPGLHAQQQAFEYGAKFAGCTVHFVNEEVDGGVIILQRSIPVLETDTADSLSARILIEEHAAYPAAIARVLSNAYERQGRRYVLRSGL